MGGAAGASAGAGAASTSAAGAATSQAASQAASSAAAQSAMQGKGGMAQEYMQKYGYNPYTLGGQYVNKAFDSVAQGMMNQKTGYSPEQYSSLVTNSPANYQTAQFIPQTVNSGGGLFSGTNFSNQAKRMTGF